MDVKYSAGYAIFDIQYFKLCLHLVFVEIKFRRLFAERRFADLQKQDLNPTAALNISTEINTSTKLFSDVETLEFNHAVRMSHEFLRLFCDGLRDEKICADENAWKVVYVR